MSIRLETNRLLLRDFVMEDATRVHLYASDPEVTRYMIWGPNSEQDTHDFMGRMLELLREEPRTVYELAVIRKEDGLLIGGCGLHVEGSAAELGYCFNRASWGQGYASEAAAAVVRLGFAELGLHRIYAKCRPDNTGSYKVMEKIGMHYEGTLREHMYTKGKWQDSRLYSILVHEHNR
jgi:RimJ/RimL family protein N-acetyltransferase